MNLFSQILNQQKLGQQGQFSGGTFGSINTEDFQSKLPEVQKKVQAEQNLLAKGYSKQEINFLKIQKEKGIDPKQSIDFIKKKREEIKNPNLGFKGTVSEGAKGLFTAPQQIPRQAGNILDFTQKYVTTPLIAGGLEAVGAEGMAEKWRSAGAKFGELAKTSGEQTTTQAENTFGPITQNQRNVRRFVGDIATTAPLSLGKVPSIIKGTGIIPTVARGAYYGAVGTPTYTAVSEGRLPTSGEMATGIVGGAVVGPLLEKVAIPAVTGIVNKTGKYGTALYKGGIEGAKKEIIKDVSAIPKNIKGAFVKTPEQKLLSKLGQEQAEGLVNGKVVNVPVPQKGIIEKVTMGFGRTSDTKVLAGRALTPSYAGKTPKQIINTTAEVEKNIRRLWEGIRTGKYEGDISTLEDAASTVVRNLEKIGASIGDDVKGAVGKITPSSETKSTIVSTLKNKIEKRSGAYSILKNFLEDTGKGLNVQDAMKAKRVYQTEIGKLIRSGDAGTDSYTALVKGVQELSDNIDEVVEKSVGSKAFLERKAQYAHLKKIVADIAKSAAVEGRRSPQTFVEQLGMVESFIDGVKNPLSTAGRMFAKEIGELNTRGGAWKELIKIYDIEAIDLFKSKPLNKPIVKPTKKTIIKPTNKTKK